MVKRSKKISCMIKYHFIQPLTPGFRSNFSIPKAFVTKLQVGENQKKDGDEKMALLRDKQGRSWEIKVDYNGMKFKKGWLNFCEDYGLEIGDFMVFRHQGNLVFDVIILDPTGCERHFPSPDHPLQFNSSITMNHIPLPGKKGLKSIEDIYMACSKLEAHNATTFKPRGHPYFRTLIKPYWSTWGGMLIPTKFAKENDLAKSSGEVILIDERGETWQLTMKQRRRRNSMYIGGWCRFHKDHSLNTGNSVVFELIISGDLPVFKFYNYT